jgi:hypothetical protein
MDDFRFPTTNPRTVQCAIEAVPTALVIGLVFGFAYVAFSRFFYAAILPELAHMFGPSAAHADWLVGSTILMMMLGSFVGVAIPVARRFHMYAGAAVACAGVLCLTGFAAWMWEARQRQHGYEPADCLLFVVPLCVAGAVAAGAMIGVWYWWSVQMQETTEERLFPDYCLGPRAPRLVPHLTAPTVPLCCPGRTVASF